ncbi:UPF0280 family protein [Acidaminobacter sp. JC074]|uniref:UPF0280 family protein n=1 Tax=Acidaminobacter sp. JC074 TaxID=2530199 RepID=UPI001F0DC57C|nr:UPF0280 family protein [Acidaminobacter sp. JC074]MCH4887207.1 UPF0280 family protein [Acidaminobacter sp. JC074]
MYQERVYREQIRSEKLHRKTLIDKETDLLIVTSSAFCQEDYVTKLRSDVSDYIGRRNEFTGLEPIDMDLFAPKVIQHMIEASSQAGVGPMATVAGAISHYVGESLNDHEIMIENGGDIYLKSNEDKVIAIYAGDSPFSNQVGIKIKSEDTPIGICTSAGKVGHSLSFGNTDAVVVISEDTLLADATATAIGNRVKTAEDIKEGLEFGKSIRGIAGIVIIIDDELGAWGDIELVSVDG